MTSVCLATQGVDHRRLRNTVKRLVIELGYLERCLKEDAGEADSSLRAAALGLDGAISHLNRYLDS